MDILIGSGPWSTLSREPIPSENEVGFGAWGQASGELPSILVLTWEDRKRTRSLCCGVRVR